MSVVRRWKKVGGVWVYKQVEKNGGEYSLAYIHTDTYYGAVLSTADLTTTYEFNHFTDLKELKRVIETTIALRSSVDGI